ncbi:M57 family metalloprotease [Paenibacillus sp. KS-LC4]|uniref:M57 family metalloprotease n=1 Tax=Paenibacillus sp. KS-LC4 TaxID=2979727 RepID=UPI0030CAEB24
MRKKSLLTAAILLLPALIFTSTAFAFTFTGHKWPKSVNSTYNVYVKYATTNTTYKAAFDTAVSDWNSAQSKIKFNLSALNTSTFSTVGTQNVDDPSMYGACITYVSPGTTSTSYFTADINIGNPSVVNFPQTRRSTTGHELGHALGLGHSSAPVTAIMNSSRNRENVYLPQTDDKNGINTLYPK